MDLIGSKREATAMATASAAKREAAKVAGVSLSGIVKALKRAREQA